MKQNGVQFASQAPHSYSLYFDMNIWFRARKVVVFFFFNFAHTNNYNTLHLQFITGNCCRLQKRNKKTKKDKVHKNTIVYILTFKRRPPALWARKVTGTFEKRSQNWNKSQRFCSLGPGSGVREKGKNGVTWEKISASETGLAVLFPLQITSSPQCEAWSQVTNFGQGMAKSVTPERVLKNLV